MRKLILLFPALAMVLGVSCLGVGDSLESSRGN